MHQDGSIPIGTVVAYAGAIEPGSSNNQDPGGLPPSQRRLRDQGWLFCDGRSVRRSVYPALYAAIGVAWGGDAGAGTFNLPDMRGRFLRGVNQGAPDFPASGADSIPRAPDEDQRLASATGGNTGGAVGSVQQDLLQTHEHVWKPADRSLPFCLEYPAEPGVLPPLRPELTGGDDNAGPTSSALRPPGDVRAGQETAPKNVYVNFLIFAGRVPR